MTPNPRGDFHGKTLMSRDVGGFMLRELVHEPGTRIPKHSHQRAHVAFVLRGVFTERCERKTLECRPLSVSFRRLAGMTPSQFRANLRKS